MFLIRSWGRAAFKHKKKKKKKSQLEEKMK